MNCVFTTRSISIVSINAAKEIPKKRDALKAAFPPSPKVFVNYRVFQDSARDCQTPPHKIPLEDTKDSKGI